MGKPFAKELEKVISTLEWGFNQDIEKFKNDVLQNKNKPLFVVGSGGSLSACNYAALLYQQHGVMAKAVTPLDLYNSKHTLRQANVLFISASGKNTDILFGYDTAICHEPNRIYSLCMKENSPLGELASKYSICKNYEFNLPSGKDGFLATNSLVAFFCILYNSFTHKAHLSADGFHPDSLFIAELEEFIDKITPDFTFVTLFAGWGQPVAIDIESKLAEAALGNILLSDYRNFGHGRHHWFDKRKNNSAIIALISPEEEKLAEKTLSVLPADIPILRIKSGYDSALASIELLVKSFYLTERLGRLQNIDPGRPGVPDFGSKLYNLKYKSLLNQSLDNVNEKEKIAIVRKANVPSFNYLSAIEKEYWQRAYKKFNQKFSEAEFGIIIFDYDGTLCSAKNRYKGVGKEVSDNLTKLLSHGIILGIATGRGQSVRNDLKESIPEQYHKQVVIGYYNGGDLGLLSDNHIPDVNLPINESLCEIYEILDSYNFPAKVKVDIRPKQLVIEIENKEDWQKVRSSIIQLIMNKIHSDNKSQSTIGILESSHSMDIIDHAVTSKLNILERCQELAKAAGLSENFLTIGDKGQWPGNDYQLLSTPFSLSVDEVSPLTHNCWNFAKPGIKNIEATLEYLSYIHFNKAGFKIKL